MSTEKIRSYYLLQEKKIEDHFLYWRLSKILLDKFVSVSEEQSSSEKLNPSAKNDIGNPSDIV